VDRNTQQVVVVGIVCAAVAGSMGFVLGNQYGRAGGRVRRGDDVVVAAPANAAPAQAEAAAPQPTGPTLEQTQAIAAAESITQREPKNAKAWIDLGNLYFDSHQPQKSVDAYSRALLLHPDDPDVLTDQGVMYRELGQFDSALANFEKASRLAPNHLQSLYNLGVVYGFDKKDVARAEEVWGRLIRMAPQSEQAVQARQSLDHLKNRTP
jgi:cytochrome c-type biogenesis protein CcmH/NrfG